MRKIFLILFIVASSAANSQIIKGKLVEENGQPLAYANVVLLSLPDSVFVSGTISGEDGSFTLEATSGNQIVKISSIGYKTIFKSTALADIGIVQLISDSQQLGEVVVKADLPKTRVKGDAMVTTVAGSILENAGTGNDLLNKIPGVSANDGNIKVFGAGTPEIYINGRKVRDQSELDQLASNNIKSVEVVNNPGSSYDATVNAVIRIQTKKSQGEGFGFNNRFYLGYGYGWNGFMREYSCYMYGSGDYDVDSILCRDNKLCYPYIQYIIQASNRLMQTMRSIDVASKRLKLPYFIVCDESQKNSVKKILEDVDSNYDNIISSKSITPDMFKLFPTQVSGEALTTLWNNYNNLDSQIKTILGVDSIVNQDKKERLITDEANAMKSISNINVEMRLAERQKFCDTVNMIFGTDIKVSVNPNFITGDEKDERMEAFDDGETLE